MPVLPTSRVYFGAAAAGTLVKAGGQIWPPVTVSAFTTSADEETNEAED